MLQFSLANEIVRMAAVNVADARFRIIPKQSCAGFRAASIFHGLAIF